MHACQSHRLVHEFAPHAAPIEALAVHPTEFLMASACADRTVRVWDLEKFEQISCTQPDSSQVRHVIFSDSGNTLLSGSEESLKVWGWEPARCYQQTSVRWSRLCDLCMAPGRQLLAGAAREAMVAVWSLEMPSANSFGGQVAPPPPQAPSSPRPTPPSAPSSSTRQITSEATPTTARMVASTAAPEGDDSHSAANAELAHAGVQQTAKSTDHDDVAAVQCARDAIVECRSQLAAARRVGKTANFPCTAARPCECLSASGNHKSLGTSMSGMLGQAAVNTGQDVGRRDVNYPNSSSVGMPACELMGAEDLPASVNQERCLTDRLGALCILRCFWESGDVKRVRRRQLARIPTMSTLTGILTSSNEVGGSSYMRLAPCSVAQMLLHLQKSNDPALAVNLIKQGGILRSGRLDLECALVLLPTLRSLLESRYNSYVVAAIHAFSELALMFGHLISNTRAIAKDKLGVDLSGEARQQRCQAAFEHFADVLPRVQELAAHQKTSEESPAALKLISVLRAQLGLSSH